MSIVHYEMICKETIVEVDDGLFQVWSTPEPICYACSLKVNSVKDNVIIAVSHTESDDLRCAICDDIITESKDINTIHKVRDVNFHEEVMKEEKAGDTICIQPEEKCNYIRITKEIKEELRHIIEGPPPIPDSIKAEMDAILLKYKQVLKLIEDGDCSKEVKDKLSRLEKEYSELSIKAAKGSNNERLH